MRKRYKEKKRSCGLCKPHKRGWATRWKVKEDPRRWKEACVEIWT